MVSAKLEQTVQSLNQKEIALNSLKEDLQDVTESHNKKVVEMQGAFDREKDEATAAVIAKYEAQMQEFEAKIQKEKDEESSKQQ